MKTKVWIVTALLFAVLTLVVVKNIIRARNDSAGNSLIDGLRTTNTSN